MLQYKKTNIKMKKNKILSKSLIIVCLILMLLIMGSRGFRVIDSLFSYIVLTFHPHFSAVAYLERGGLFCYLTFSLVFFFFSYLIPVTYKIRKINLKNIKKIYLILIGISLIGLLYTSFLYTSIEGNNIVKRDFNLKKTAYPIKDLVISQQYIEQSRSKALSARYIKITSIYLNKFEQENMIIEDYNDGNIDKNGYVDQFIYKLKEKGAFISSVQMIDKTAR